MRATKPDKHDSRVDYELLRNLLTQQPDRLEELARDVPSEIVYKALIIRQFMAERGIFNIHEGVRQFVAFQRDQLKRLEWIN